MKNTKKLQDKQIELILDFSALTQKWTAPKMADALGISKQLLHKYQQDEKKKEAKK